MDDTRRGTVKPRPPNQAMDKGVTRVVQLEEGFIPGNTASRHRSHATGPARSTIVLDVRALSLCHIAGPRGPLLTCDTIVDGYLTTVPTTTRRLHASGLGRALRALRPDATHLTWRDVVVESACLDAALHARADSPRLIAWALTAVRGLAAYAHMCGWLTTSDYERTRDSQRRAPRRGRMPNAPPGAVAALLLTALRDTTLAGRRDAALLALLCHPTVVHSEIARLVPADVDLAGHRLHVQRLVGGPHTIHVPLPAAACEALAHWLAARGDGPGRLFLPIDKAGRIVGDTLSPAIFPVIIERRAARAGLGAISSTDLRPVGRPRRHATAPRTGASLISSR